MTVGALGARRAAALPALVAVCALALTGSASASSYLFTVEQVGPNVVATGSGQIDLTGLTQECSCKAPGGVISPVESVLHIGTGLNTLYGGVSGPQNFGPGGFKSASSSSGSPVAIDMEHPVSTTLGTLYVPAGYISDTFLSTSTATFDNATFASLGITSGTYVWSWGQGADQRVTAQIGVQGGAAPLPAALPLFATGLGAMGFLGWRRKRKTQAVA